MRHLDTNIAIAYLNKHKGVLDRFKDALPNVAVSAPVLAELYYGAFNSLHSTSNLEKLRLLLDVIHVVPIDGGVAERFGQIRTALKSIGKPTSTMDLFIGSAALHHQSILVTHNTRHFEYIPGLTLEDWLS
jgi:tRNA(fMet)-specific endonuclease VapC